MRTYVVRPTLPKAIAGLDTVARNLWWCWNHGAVELFQRLDRDLWEVVGHNPLALIAKANQATLEAAAADDGFVSQLEGVLASLRAYLAAPTWFSRHGASAPPVPGAKIPAEAWPVQRIAYFSAEFGLSEAVPIYSGGLGVLAGDHLKSASDLGLPLVAVTLLYREAFHQYLNADGWQQEAHPETDLTLMPVSEAKGADGRQVVISVDLPGRSLRARVWRLDVGRVQLFLLDTNHPENQAEDRRITDRLYGGDLEMRIKQEILLGIGGLRALDALGMSPAVCHMNEGHSAFNALERIRRLMHERGLSFAEARELGAAGGVFTTHTPVPAGNDRFPPDMVDRYFGSWPGELGLSHDEFLGLGRETPSDPLEHFCLTVLALKLATRANGVSRLHGAVSRQMWRKVYPNVPVHEIPIGSITNGVHQRSFLSADMRRLFDSYLGPKWVSDPDDPEVWERIDRIPAEELWRAHERCRERTIAFARARLASHVERRGGGPREIAESAEVLDPHALTIGFARRFATYKRATLVLRDPERLAKILNTAGRPVQFIFAGKAHQKDEPGKEVIRKVVHLANQAEFRHKVVFLEDYDINVARMLVQGVDVWLNTPVRPLEASGTSGMKAVVNGAIHVSVLDGWWAECYSREVGWAIGNAEEYADREVGERIEADALYHLLETEIAPVFYDRGRDGLPRRWIELMKTSMKRLGPVFNTQRMVREYFDTAYAPAARQVAALAEQGDARARALAAYKRRVAAAWPQVAVRSVESASGEISVGQALEVTARVTLGELSPGDVEVQLYQGPVDSRGELVDGGPQPMQVSGDPREGAWTYTGAAPSRVSGRFGYSVRVLPKHPDLGNPFDFVFPKWG